MTVARMLDHIEVEVSNENTLIILLGSGFHTMFDPDLRQGRIAYAGDDMLYLISASNCLHYSAVRVESWSQEPPAVEGWPDREDTTMRLTSIGFSVSAMMEHPIGPQLELPSAGLYHVRVQAQGRQELLRLDRVARVGPEAMPRGVERFLVQLWPAPPTAGR